MRRRGLYIVIIGIPAIFRKTGAEKFFYFVLNIVARYSILSAVRAKGEESMKGTVYFEDGTVFRGKGFGYEGTKVGEIVFNTAMTGYQ